SDVAAAIEWARTAAPEFGGDRARVALWGESAGGYLAALAVTTGAVSGVAGVVDTFGLTDLSQVAMDFDDAERARHHTAEITEAQYLFGRRSGMTIDDDPAVVQRANPVARVAGDEPPFLLLHGERDGLVSPGQTQLLHRALLDHGVDSTRYVVAGAGHYGLEWSSRTVVDLIVGHLRRRLDQPAR
ncbi:MAG: alpha/beta hydrolase, partial [Ilumatobacter sp.]|nr:alpha/beta hydrolase [Ilumatobacter sp.]